MSEINAWLTGQAMHIRQETEPAWNSDTICPGYVFNPKNSAFGQCGVTRDVFGFRIEKIKRTLGWLSSLLQQDTKGTYTDGKTIDLADTVRQSYPDLHDFTVQYNKWLSGNAILYEYGHAVDQINGRRLYDHCWLRIVGQGYEKDVTKGFIVELTLDQFNTDEINFEPVLVLPADSKDSLVTYYVERSELSDERQFEPNAVQRFNKLNYTKMRMPYHVQPEDFKVKSATNLLSYIDRYL